MSSMRVIHTYLFVLGVAGAVAVTVIGTGLRSRSRSGTDLVPARVMCQAIALTSLPLLGYAALCRRRDAVRRKRTPGGRAG